MMKTKSFLIRALGVTGATMLVLLASACTSIPAVGDPANPLSRSTAAPDKINWPTQYKPENATFAVSHAIDIKAPPQVVWDIIVNAEAWPSWYQGATNVKVQNVSDGKLKADSAFSWQTMGQDFTSKIMEFNPPYRLSWESRKSTIQGYHAWLIVPSAGGGARLISDESMHGFLASMQSIFLPNKLAGLHEIWLAEIKKKAEAVVAAK
jgi:uncharacterized protein YndB with AHSA1/START domain